MLSFVLAINQQIEIIHISETHQQILPPDFTKNLKSVDVLESSPLSMECHVTGIPSPTISWYRDDQSIDSSPEYIITKINGTCCLKIRQAARHHSARYTCRANNPGGEAASSARITVVRKETFTSRLEPGPQNVLMLCTLPTLWFMHGMGRNNISKISRGWVGSISWCFIHKDE